MGAMKDLVELADKLTSSIKDRKIRELFLPIQEKILEVQKDQFAIEQKHSSEMLDLKQKQIDRESELKTLHANEVADLKTQYANAIQQLETKIEELQKKQLPEDFTVHGGLLWKKTDGKWERTPYCSQCKMPVLGTGNKWVCTNCGHATQRINPPR